VCSSDLTKDIKDLSEEPSSGLDTIPFYQKGSSAFDTKAALQALEAEKKAEEQRKAGISEEIKKRFEGQTANSGIPDPWIPPATIKTQDLPLPLKDFPKDIFGYPDWTAAVREGVIRPRGYIGDAAEEGIFDKDILFEIKDRLMANVVFSHNVHTYWLSCKVCHPAIFIDKKGANKFTMYDVWNGKYCGRCHGKVAFQAKGFENCQRCHSSKKKGKG
jgi:c(7)-type cytochrome triheme protein